jgi:hypothetical protein
VDVIPFACSYYWILLVLYSWDEPYDSYHINPTVRTYTGSVSFPFLLPVDALLPNHQCFGEHFPLA